MQHLCSGSLSSTPTSLQIFDMSRVGKGFSRCIELNPSSTACAGPRQPLSFNLAAVLPGGQLHALASLLKQQAVQQTSWHRLGRGTTRVSNPVCSLRFLCMSVVQVQGLPAIGVPPHIYAFHCYTREFHPLCRTLALQSQMPFPGWARDFTPVLYKTACARFTPSNSD